MKPPIRAKPGKGTNFPITDESGEVIASALSEETARGIVRAVNFNGRLEKELERTEKELAQFKASPKDLKPIDLTKISRNSQFLFTSIRFEGSELSDVLMTTDEEGRKRGHDWLTLGECTITNEGRICFIGSRMRDGVTDFEHDSCYVAHISLVGLQYKFTNHHVSYFEANLTPRHEDIKIYDPDFEPEQVKGAWRCKEKSCEDKHLMLPDGNFTPPTYKLARVVAGARVTIVTGPRWDVIEKR